MTIDEMLDKEGFNSTCWNECDFYAECKEPHGEVLADCGLEFDGKDESLCPRME